jgi:hypothetical protein
MYKCGWNGCEKAYGTLNHLNAHVTMQSHGSKRTPEGEFIPEFMTASRLAVFPTQLKVVQISADWGGPARYVYGVAAGAHSSNKRELASAHH